MSAKSSAPHRRRQWIVNRALQYRFTGAMLLFLCATILLALVGVYLALWATLHTFQLQRDPVTVALFTTAGVIMSFEIILMAPIVIWVGIRLTHRIAGPLVRIHAALRQMRAGDFDVRLQLRKDDALPELADDVNRLAASLRTHRP